MRRLARVLTAVAAGVFAALNAVPYLAQSQPLLTVSPTSGQPGDRITITGTGFPPGEVVGLYFDVPTFFLDAPGPRADAQGNITDKVNVTDVAPGSHSICGDTAYPGSSQPVAAKACTAFTVLRKVTTPSAQGTLSPGATATGPPVPLPLVGLAILLVLAGITGLLVRGSR